MKTKTKGVLVLGLVLVATIAMLCVLPASAAMNGDTDQTQTQDKLQDKAQDGSCGCDCQQDLTQLRTKLQIRDCLSKP